MCDILDELLESGGGEGWWLQIVTLSMSQLITPQLVKLKRQQNLLYRRWCQKNQLWEVLLQCIQRFRYFLGQFIWRFCRGYILFKNISKVIYIINYKKKIYLGLKLKYIRNVLLYIWNLVPIEIYLTHLTHKRSKIPKTKFSMWENL